MGRASDDARRKVDLARISLGISDELGDRLGRNRWMHQHDVGHDHNAGDRRDVTDEIEVELVIERRVHRVRRMDQEERIAISGRTHDRLRGDITAGAAGRAAPVAGYWAIAPSPTWPCNRALDLPAFTADSLVRRGRGGGAVWLSAGSDRCSGLTCITTSSTMCSGRMPMTTSGLMPTTTSIMESTVLTHMAAPAWALLPVPA